MKKLLLPFLALVMFLPACTPDEELIEPTNPLLDDNIFGEWRLFSPSGFNTGEFYETSYSYFFMPDGAGFTTTDDASTSNDFTYTNYLGVLNIFGDWTVDYTISDDGNEMVWKEINDDTAIRRLEKQ